MPSNKWNPALWGKAKAEFNKAQKPPPNQPAKAVETAGRGSEMVKRTRPAMNGPKPSGPGGHIMAQATFNHQLRKEHAAAKSQPIKKEISLEDQAAIARLNEKFRKSAARERTHDKGL